jgi:hypothetical protein
MDTRIAVRTVVQHVTPDGQAFEDPAKAERHLAYLDRKAREERLRDALDSVFWSDSGLQAQYDHDNDRFKDRVVELVSSDWDLLKALALYVPEIAAAWEEKIPQVAEEAEPVPAKPSRRGRG